MEQSKTKRVQVVLPGRIYTEIEQWARADGRPVANLCAFLIETQLKQAKKDGSYPGTAKAD